MTAQTSYPPFLCRRHATAFVALIGIVGFGIQPSGAAPAENRQLDLVRSEHGQLRREYAEVLNGLATELQRAGALEAATEALSLAVPSDPRQITISQLPASVLPDIPASAPTEVRAALLKLQQAREKQSVDLYLLSRRAITAGATQYAYELLREAATQDPDNPTARKILGFKRVGNEWLTPFEARMRYTKQVWHENYGWIPESHIPRYDAGERFSGGRWVSSENDAELHRDFSNPWIIRTEHYLVKTNHSLERGVEVASKLETFHGFFVETFAGFFSRPEDLQKLFRGGGNRAVESKPYEVHYYRTRDEYNERLVSKIENIAITNGLYYTNDRIAYFFHDEKLTLDDTLYHEATHQIMYECLPRPREVATEAHFWAIEGIACYMESFKVEKNGDLTIGDVRHPRIIAARHRYVTDKYYVPIGKFAAMGLHQFQSVPLSEMQRNYSQASGLAHFLMHFDQGRYRDAFIEHLAQLYHGVGPYRKPAQNLAELTRIAYVKLDQEYGDYIKDLGTAQATASVGN